MVCPHSIPPIGNYSNLVQSHRQPVTKLGRLVKDGKIKSMEEIYLFSLPVKEYQIVDFFLPKLKDEVMKIMPVQKQTRAGQRTRFKAFVAIGDHDGHVGLGVKCAKEVATAIRGAITLAKLSVIPVRRGYWGAALGEPHTVPSKVSGKVGSVMCRLIPAPRGTGIVAAPASKRLLQLAGVQDVYTQSKGSTATMGNFLKATFAAVSIIFIARIQLVVLDWNLLNSSMIFRLPKPTRSSRPISGERFPYPRTLTTNIAPTLRSQRKSSVRRKGFPETYLFYSSCHLLCVCTELRANGITLRAPQTQFRNPSNEAFATSPSRTRVILTNVLHFDPWN